MHPKPGVAITFKEYVRTIKIIYHSIELKAYDLIVLNHMPKWNLL